MSEKNMVTKARDRIESSDDEEFEFTVESENPTTVWVENKDSNSEYLIVPEVMSCSCPDYKYNSPVCKHIIALSRENSWFGEEMRSVIEDEHGNDGERIKEIGREIREIQDRLNELTDEMNEIQERKTMLTLVQKNVDSHSGSESIEEKFEKNIETSDDLQNDGKSEFAHMINDTME